MSACGSWKRRGYVSSSRSWKTCDVRGRSPDDASAQHAAGARVHTGPARSARGYHAVVLAAREGPERRESRENGVRVGRFGALRVLDRVPDATARRRIEEGPQVVHPSVIAAWHSYSEPLE